MKMISIRSLALALALPTVLASQQLRQMVRSTVATTLGDSSLTLLSDTLTSKTTFVTKATSIAQIRKILATRALDSIITAGIVRLTGATIVGSPTWSNLQTFAAGQLVDSATGAVRAASVDYRSHNQWHIFRR